MSSQPWVPHADRQPVLRSARGARGTPVARATAADRWLLRAFLRAAGSPKIRVVLWDGWSTSGVDATPLDRVRIADRATLLRLIYDPELAFGEAYTEGRLTVEGDLVRLLRSVFEAPAAPLAARLLRRTHRPRRNSLHGSRDNIHRHYDLGNDFYRLWLDERDGLHLRLLPDARTRRSKRRRWRRWSTSAASWRCAPASASSRPAAAGARWRCTWRGSYGVTVRAFNISHEQIAYAREQRGARRARRPGRVRRGRLPQHHRHVRRVRVGRHARARRPRPLPRPRRASSTAACRRTGAGSSTRIGRNRPMRAQRLDREAHLPRRLHPPTLREMMDIFEPYEPLGARRREPAPALRARRAALAASASSSTASSVARDVRRALRARLAPLSRRLDRRVPAPACCSSSRSLSRATSTTTCRGRGRICTSSRCAGAAGATVRADGDG